MKLIIIDGNSLINRAYYALQRPMITKTGLYTHGVYGFLNMLNKIINDYSPDYISVAFDRKAPTFRHLEYAEYKAGRKKMPPELAMQLPLLKEVLEAMKINMLEIDGFEADDIIGTVTKRAEEAGLESLVITGDKDELQLASNSTKILITRKGISEFDLYDEAAMIEKYGFTPEQFIDFKGLMGDQSDNIPGIPGVGEKTALKLIQEYGSIQELIASTDSIKSKSLKEKVEENAQLALMSRRLATINREVPIEINFEELLMEKPDYSALIEVYKKLEFNSLLKKLLVSEVQDISDPHAGNPSVSSQDQQVVEEIVVDLCIIKEEKDLEILKSDLSKGSSVILKVFNDQNHKDVPMIYGISIMSTKVCYYMPMDDNRLLKGLAQILDELEIKLIGHNLKSDYYALLANDYATYSQDTGASIFRTAFDTAIAQYLIEPSRSNYDLKTMILEYFHADMEDEATFLSEHGQIGFLADAESKYAEFGRNWCIAVKKLMIVLSEKLIQEELEPLLTEIELPLIEVLASMEQQGFAVDRKELTDAGLVIGEKIEELSEKIYALAGEKFNINSPIQMGPILFEKLGLPYGKKTKRGYATGVEVLEKLKDDYEIVALILDYRMYSKLKSTYIEGLLPLIHRDHKIHAHFQQTVAATGRISCTEPNLQNIPIKQDLGRKLRKAFIPESSDYVLIGADYSQIELRILAHMSQDPTLIHAFNEGDDIHRITASKVFGVPENEVTHLQRSNAKAVNFGVIYGMSGFGLSTELNITRKEAEQYIEEYFNKYTKVKEFLDGLVKSGKEKGYVTTIMNRKRTVNEINASNYMVRQAGERLAMNSPIQGSAADIIKLAMIKVYQELRSRKTKSQLILQVHDELIIQTHMDEVDQIRTMLQDCMEQAIELSVNLSVDVNTGRNWYELK